MRIAFVGGVGHHYLQQLLAPPAAHRVACVDDPHDSDAARRFAAASLPAGAPVFADIPTMLRDFRPDVVSVGVVYGYAADAIAACVATGVPVVSDKPIATTWAGYERVVTATRAPGAGTLVTEFDFRARPAFRAARQAVGHGQVGTVALVTAQKSYRWGNRPAWYAQREAYGSTLLWIASHAIDALRFVSGAEPECRFARQANVTRGSEWGSAEDVVVAAYALPGGGSALVHADFLRPAAAPSHGDDRLRVAGDRGVIEVINDRCWLTTIDAPPTDITDTTATRDPGHEMLDAVMNGGNEYFSTAESLRTAELLLRTLDRANGDAAIGV
jgi:predicted dehydrogenase